MEDLFSTRLTINNKSIGYRIVFDNEKYVFFPDQGQAHPASFSFRRQHDEWVEDGPVPQEVRSEAIDALDRYLLRQH